jgi:chromate transporter
VVLDAFNKGTAPAPYNKVGFAGVKIEPIYVDENGGATKQVQELRNLYDREKVDAVVGYVGSGDCLAVAPAATLPAGSLLWQIALFFTKAGAFVFGSGLAIVPFLYGGVVKEHGWLNDRDFLDAVAVAMITPGPVVITVGFIGYLVAGRSGDVLAGVSGAGVAALATFLPCWLFTVIPAPYFKKHGKRPGIVAFVDGVTAAAVGAIAGACVVLGRRTLFTDGWIPDPVKVAILLVTIGLLFRFKKLPEPVLVLAAAVAGLLLAPAAGG